MCLQETKEIFNKGKAGRLMGGSKKSLWQRLKKQGALQLFVLAGMLYLVIFNFIPMFGLVMGFKDYTISSGIKGIFTSEWVGRQL